MARTSYDTVNPQAVGTALERPPGTPGRTEAIQRLAKTVAGTMLGKVNIGGAVTLTGTSTTLKDARIGGQSLLFFMAHDAAGATAIPSLYVATRLKGQATL